MINKFNEQNQVVYSICMANLNMQPFIQAAILSIYNQTDQDYELIIVDGGSTDGSIEILKELERKLTRLHVIYLPLDPERKLGTDRNISIKQARGKYVLLHIDCDDLYFPFIKDWVAIFHVIISKYKNAVLVAGNQINMGKRASLLERGPYKNLNFEDRELWTRLEAKNELVRWKHKNLRIRMKLTRLDQIMKSISRGRQRILEDLLQPENRFFPYLVFSVLLSKTYTFRQKVFYLILTSSVFVSYAKSPKKSLLEAEAIVPVDIRDQISISTEMLLNLKTKQEWKEILSDDGNRFFFDND